MKEKLMKKLENYQRLDGRLVTWPLWSWSSAASRSVEAWSRG